MEIVYDGEQLDRYIGSAVQVSGKNPVLIDSYLRQASEVDVDVVADGEAVYIAGVMEHIEEAGIPLRRLPPAPCRPTPCPRRSSPRSAARPPGLPRGSAWSA